MPAGLWRKWKEPDVGLRLAGVTPEMQHLIESSDLTTRSGSSVVPLLDGGQQLEEAFGVINMY